MSNQEDETQFWDDFMDVVDGEPSALDAYADLLADSAELRDARFEAEHAVRRLAEAGDDWNPTADFEARLVTAIEAQAQTAQQPASAATALHAKSPTPDGKAARCLRQEMETALDTKRRAPRRRMPRRRTPRPGAGAHE